ncbi:MAG: DNA gyrase inhibitor YacG [Methylocella sp.]
MPAAKPESPFSERLAETEVRPCPVCGKPAALSTRPFCSKRCADVDLHRWLAGVYAIPAGHDSDAEPDGAGKQ